MIPCCWVVLGLDVFQVHLFTQTEQAAAKQVSRLIVK